MGLFDSASEKQRKENLRSLEDRRVAFAKRLREAGYKSEHSLYGQRGGGFSGIVISGDDYLYITGPAPGEDADFSVGAHKSVRVRTEEIVIPSEGMGGVLGFGKRGGMGYKLHLTFPDASTGEIEIVSGMNCYYENVRGTDPLFDENRRRGDANFVWEFRPVEQAKIKPVVMRWLEALGDTL